MNVSINKERTIDLLRRMVQIDSINPSLVPGAKGEMALAEFITQVLADAGIEVALTEVEPRRPNVLAALRGAGGGRTLILNGHTDTVSVAGMSDPFSARIDGGKMYGRGTMDMKGGLAAGLAAMLALHEGGVQLKGDMVLACVCDEELASIGSEALVKSVSGDGCIVLEPRLSAETSPAGAIWAAHGGFVLAEIETEGVAAHGSSPDRGVDAIVKMGHVLLELEKLGHHLQSEKSFVSPLAHETMRPSVHASLIEGGRELSSYPDLCTLSIERRLIPTETGADVEAELDAMLQRLAAEDPQFKAQWRVILAREPWQVTASPLLEALDQACIAEMGQAPARSTVMAWADSAIMEGAGIPTVVYGPVGDGAHAVVEYVELDSVLQCARILARTAIAFCA